MAADDPEPFRWAWIALGLGLFTALVFGAMSVCQWYLKATMRPTVDVPSEVQR